LRCAIRKCLSIAYPTFSLSPSLYIYVSRVWRKNWARMTATNQNSAISREQGLFGRVDHHSAQPLFLKDAWVVLRLMHARLSTASYRRGSAHENTLQTKLQKIITTAVPFAGRQKGQLRVLTLSLLLYWGFQLSHSFALHSVA
jgi:hypothetical protein